MTRAVEVGVVSARATKCGYYFDPQQLRTSFLAAEAQRTPDPVTLKKIETAHDFAQRKVANQIAKQENYCTADRTEATKNALTRYLAGDFSARKRTTTVAAGSGGILGSLTSDAKPESFDPAAIHDPLLNKKK